MKLTTEKYTIEYEGSYENGCQVHGYNVIIDDVCIYIEYSYEQNAIISRGTKSEGLDEELVERALLLCEYAELELRAVCKFMLDLI